VEVESRTQPGINKAGGVGRVMRVFPGSQSTDTMYSIKYVLGGSERRVAEEFIHQVGFLHVRRTPKPVDFFGDTISTSTASSTADAVDSPRQSRSRRATNMEDQSSKRVRAAASGDDTVMLNLILKTGTADNKSNSNGNRSSDALSDDADDEVIFAPVARVAKRKNQNKNGSQDQGRKERDRGNMIVLSVKGMAKQRRTQQEQQASDSPNIQRIAQTPQRKKNKKRKHKDNKTEQQQHDNMLIGNLSPQSTISNDTAMTPTFNRDRRVGGAEWDGVTSPLTPTWSGNNDENDDLAADDYSPPVRNNSTRAVGRGPTPVQRRMLAFPKVTIEKTSAASMLLKVRNNNKRIKKRREKQRSFEASHGVAAEANDDGQDVRVKSVVECKKKLSMGVASAKNGNTHNVDNASREGDENVDQSNGSTTPKESANGRKVKLKKEKKHGDVGGVTVLHLDSSSTMPTHHQSSSDSEWVRGDATVSVGVETSLKSALKRAEMHAKMILREALSDYEHPQPNNNNSSTCSNDAEPTITSVNPAANNNNTFGAGRSNSNRNDTEEEEEDDFDEDEEDVRADVSSFLRRTFMQHRQERTALAKDFMEQYRRLKQHWVTQLQHEGLVVQGALTPTRLLSSSLDALCRRVQPGWYSSHEGWAARASVGGGISGVTGACGRRGERMVIDQMAVQTATRRARASAIELVRNQNMESRALNAQQKSAVLEVLEDYGVHHVKVCTLARVGVPLLFPNLELVGPRLL
jgi:hypothetical protein